MFTEMVGNPGSLYFTRVLDWMMELTCYVKKVVLFTFSPLFIVHKSFRNLSYAGTYLIMSRRGILTFICLSTSKISIGLFTPFLPLSAFGKSGGMLFFIISSFITILSESSSCCSLVASSGLGIG